MNFLGLFCDEVDPLRCSAAVEVQPPVGMPWRLERRSLNARGAPLEVQGWNCSAEWTWTLETHKEAEFCLQTEVLKDYEDHPTGGLMMMILAKPKRIFSIHWNTHQTGEIDPTGIGDDCFGEAHNGEMTAGFTTI